MSAYGVLLGMMGFSTFRRTAISVGLVGLVLLAILPSAAGARPATCFGKKINRVVNGSHRTVHLKWRDVAWIAGDRVTVKTKPYAVVCADRGRQTVYPGKGRALVSTGAGDDRIILGHSNLSVIRAGLGNDFIRGAAGHDFLYASPRHVPSGVADRDVVHGLGGNDRIYDYGGVGNRLYGDKGSDRIYSLGNAVSALFGGTGSDYLYSNGGSTGSRIEQLFGERGNDHLDGTMKPSNGPAFFDPGSGDDWVDGTNRGDTIVRHSGSTTIRARGGDDVVITTAQTNPTYDGGSGRDTISFAPQTPPDGGNAGVTVDLGAGYAKGSWPRAISQPVRRFENVEGSPVNDLLIGRRGVNNVLSGGLGNDTLDGNANDYDRADGGLGQNDCQGFTIEANCNDQSPGVNDHSKPVVNIDQGGMLTVLGTGSDDRITVGYRKGSYRVHLDSAGIYAGLCSGAGRVATCKASPFNLNGVVIDGDSGDDRVLISNSVPAAVNTTINGGTGRNVLIGGRTKDNMLTAEGHSAGSVMKGNRGSDVFWMQDDVTVQGGPGADVIHSRNVCVGGSASGGSGIDNLAFPGALAGVDANLARGTAKWVSRSCARPLKIVHDIEKLEGTRYNDHLTLGRRFPKQEGRGGLLGRLGIDVLNSRNGVQDSVATGTGGHRNRVIADPIDKIIWGWGLTPG